MKKLYNKRLVSSICIAILSLAPTLVTATEVSDSNNNVAVSKDASVTVKGSGVTAISVGASVQGGSYNVAVGNSILVVNAQAVLDPVYEDLIPLDSNNNGHMGYNSRADGGTANRAIGYGAWAVGDRNTAMGALSQAQGYENTAIGYNAQATGGGSVAIGAYSIANEPNTVSVGQPGYERRIMNVAPGYYDTDAVNMSQLRNTEDKVNRVGAVAMAMSGLAPMGYNPKEPPQYSAAVGTFEGRQAFALGLYHYIHEDVMVNVAIGSSFDRFEMAGRAGVTWWGGSSKDKNKKVEDNTIFVTNVSTPVTADMKAKVEDNKIIVPVSKLGDTDESVFMQTLKKH